MQRSLSLILNVMRSGERNDYCIGNLDNEADET